MSTIVGVESDGAVALAADRGNVTDGTKTGSVDRLFEFGTAAAVAVGDQGSVDSFGRRLEAELDRERLERDVDVGRLVRMAADIASEENVEAIVAARDDDGAAALRSVDSHGAVLDDTVAAFGSGTQVALGILESETFDDEPSGLEDHVREVLATVAERDADTGDDIASWSLSADS